MPTPITLRSSFKTTDVPYKMSYLDTTGDLRPSVERELISIGRGFESISERLGRWFFSATDEARSYITSYGTEAYGELLVKITNNSIRVRGIIRRSIASGATGADRYLYTVNKPIKGYNNVVKPYTIILRDLTSDYLERVLPTKYTTFTPINVSLRAGQSSTWVMLDEEWFFY